MLGPCYDRIVIFYEFLQSLTLLCMSVPCLNRFAAYSESHQDFEVAIQ